MNFNKNDIEFYLLTKDYEALTPEEFAIVSEGVKSKEDYLVLKQLLLAMEEAPADIELTPNPELKDRLVADFEKARWNKGVGATKAKVVPLQKEESKKKKGGLFWISIAASITLVIGIYYNREVLFVSTDDQLAFVDTTKSSNSKKGQQNTTLIETENEEVFTDSVTPLQEQALVELITENELSRLRKENRKEERREERARLKAEKEGDFISYSDDSEMDLAEVMTSSAEQAKMAKPDAITSYAAEKEEEVLLDERLAIKKERTTVSQSVSLQNDKELIGLLYTAL